MKIVHLKFLSLLLFPLLGGLIFQACQKNNNPAQEEKNVDYYTCPMHPQIHQDGPGQCPICGMDLVPVYENQSPTQEGTTGQIYLHPDSLQKAGVVTASVAKQEFTLTLKGYGQVGVSSTYPPLYDTSLLELNFTEQEGALLAKDLEVEIENLQKEKIGKGKITYVKNYLDPETRLIGVFVKLNDKKDLKINSFITGTVSLALGEKTTIPKPALISQGLQNLVYVLNDQGGIKARFVKIGPHNEEVYVVLEGLKAGEQVIKNGHFLIDAESQIRGMHD